MSRKIMLLISAFLLCLTAAYVYGQYTGFDLEQKQPPTLFPKPGPGEMAIVNELRQTNRLLEQNNQLLQDQNRLLTELLTLTAANRKK